MSIKHASLSSLARLAILAVILYAVAETTRSPDYARAFAQKNDAVRLMQRAEAAILAAKVQRDVPIDYHNDPERTGLIGPQFSLITTDRGSQESKNLAAHPNFAAAAVQMFLEAGMRRGDLVAVGVTGSLPGLNLAVLSACSVLGLEPVVITSVGSSMFGATDPEMTWLDMEAVLARDQILPYRSVAASLGGGADVGRGLSPAGRQLIHDAINASGARMIEPSNLLEAVRKRVSIYDRVSRTRGKEIRMFVNVGGGVASVGGAQNARLIRTGLSRKLVERTYPNRGVLNVFAERGVPVIHLLEVEQLARRYGIVDRYDEPAPVGKGPLFLTMKYNLWLVASSALLLFVACLFVLRRDLRHQMLGKPHPERVASDPAPTGSRVLLAVLLFLLLAGAASAETWQSIEELAGHPPVAVLVEGTARRYFRVTPQAALDVDLKGPVRLRVVVRPEIPWTDGRPAVFRVAARTEARLLEEHEWQSPPSTEARLPDGGTVGESRQMIVAVPRGEHRVRLSVEGEPVLLRLLTAPPGTSREKRVTLTPISAARSVSLIDEERIIPYYSAFRGKPVHYRVVGPISLELLVRLDFDLTMRGTQSYRLRIKDNGDTVGDYSFTTTKVLTATWRELPDRVPSKFRRVSLSLGRGTHNVEVALLKPANGSIEVNARIPVPEFGKAE